MDTAQKLAITKGLRKKRNKIRQKLPHCQKISAIMLPSDSIYA